MLLSSMRRSASQTATNIAEIIVLNTLLCQRTMSHDHTINTPSSILKIYIFFHSSSHSTRECYRKTVPKSHSSFNHFETKYINAFYLFFLTENVILYCGLTFCNFEHLLHIYMYNIFIYSCFMYVAYFCIDYTHIILSSPFSIDNLSKQANLVVSYKYILLCSNLFTGTFFFWFHFTFIFPEVCMV